MAKPIRSSGLTNIIQRGTTILGLDQLERSRRAVKERRGFAADPKDGAKGRKSSEASSKRPMTLDTVEETQERREKKVKMVKDRASLRSKIQTWRYIRNDRRESRARRVCLMAGSGLESLC